MPINRASMLATLTEVAENDRLVHEATSLRIGWDADRGYLAVEVTTVKPVNTMDGPQFSDEHCLALTGYPACQVQSITVTHGTVEAVIVAVDADGRRVMRADGAGYVKFRVFRPIVP